MLPMLVHAEATKKHRENGKNQKYLDQKDAIQSREALNKRLQSN